MLDPFVLGAVLARDIRYLAKAELWSSRALARVLDDLGAIPVARGRGDREAIAAAVAALGNGEVVGVFPEGGVRRAGPWHRGAARMALLTGASVLPVRLLAVERALGVGVPGRPRIGVLVGHPVEVAPSVPTIAAARALTDRLRAEVFALGA